MSFFNPSPLGATTDLFRQIHLAAVAKTNERSTADKCVLIQMLEPKI